VIVFAKHEYRLPIRHVIDIGDGDREDKKNIRCIFALKEIAR